MARVSATTPAICPGLGDLPGIDLRATGGYVVAPPSLHVSGNRYEWLARPVQIEDPNGRDQCHERDQGVQQPLRHFAEHSAPRPSGCGSNPAGPSSSRPPRFRDADGTPQGKAALQRQLDILSRAHEGERNHTLNRCAFIVGLVHPLRPPRRDLRPPCAAHRGFAIGLPDWETQRTLDSALGTGGEHAVIEPNATERWLYFMLGKRPSVQYREWTERDMTSARWLRRRAIQYIVVWATSIGVVVLMGRPLSRTLGIVVAGLIIMFLHTTVLAEQDRSRTLRRYRRAWDRRSFRGCSAAQVNLAPSVRSSHAWKEGHRDADFGRARRDGGRFRSDRAPLVLRDVF